MCEFMHFDQLATKNLKFNVVIMIYCQRNSIFLRQKILQYSLFDRPELGFVRAKIYLAGHHDWRPAVRYFQPCPG